MKKLLLKTLLFSTFFCFIIYHIDNYFTKNGGLATRYKNVYKNEKNIEILFLGNSHGHCAFNTDIINAKLSSHSLNLCDGGTNIFQTYYSLLEVLNYHEPKLVVIEVFSILERNLEVDLKDNMQIYKVRNFAQIESKRLGLVKFKEAKVTNSYTDNGFLNVFNIYKNHEIWADLEKMARVIDLNLSFKEFRNYRKSFSSLSPERIKAFENYERQKDKNGEEIILSKEEIQEIKKIINLSKEKKFDLLFVVAPIYKGYYKKVKTQYTIVNKELEEIFDEYDNVKWLDINNKWNGANASLIMNEKVNNNQHLNYKGGMKVSSLMVDFLDKNYSFIKKESTKILETPEDLVFNSKILKSIDTTFHTAIKKINGKNTKEIKLSKNLKNLSINGWMVKENENMNQSEKIIALKKDDDMIFLSNSKMFKNKKNKKLERFGRQAGNAEYDFRFPINILDTGKYSLYSILKTNDGKFFSKKEKKVIYIVE